MRLSEKSAKNAAAHGTIQPEEIARFSALAEEWWNPHGAMRPLHRLNPIRLAYIQQRIASHYGAKKKLYSVSVGKRRMPFRKKQAGMGHSCLFYEPFSAFRRNRSISVLDMGCGAGLVSENLARMGFDVTGVDASADLIAAAQAHRQQSGVKVAYKVGTVEGLATQKPRYDVVLALEILEHVANPALFVAAASRLLKPGGVCIFSTLNRTAKSLGLAIIAAEYLLQWLPVGTHDWRKCIKPSELAAWASAAGLQVDAITGLTYHPLRGCFALCPHDVAVNYFMVASNTNGLKD